MGKRCLRLVETRAAFPNKRFVQENSDATGIYFKPEDSTE